MPQFFQAFAQNLKSGGVLKPEQAIMDIRHYTIALDVDPHRKTINGYTEIDLILLESSDILFFDLWSGFTVNNVLVNGKKQNFTHTNDDQVKINLVQVLPASMIEVRIAYGGTPGIAARPPWDRRISVGKRQQGQSLDFYFLSDGGRQDLFSL